VYIVDQLSAIVPALRILTGTRVIFYCHYPDKEVGNSIARQKAIDRGQSGPGLLRMLYRLPFDFLEEMTISEYEAKMSNKYRKLTISTGTSDKIMVNSQFTSNQFVKTFFRLSRIPRVVYPGIDLSDYDSDKIVKANQKLKIKEQQESQEYSGKGAFSVKEGIRKLIESK
jgi:alpha-1,3/alpha-1,6-mannosyltransferase